MVKKSISRKNFIRKIRAKKPKRSRKRKSKSKQRGGKIVMAQRYFNPNHTNHYYTAEELAANGGINPQAVSQGNYNGTNNSIGPNLHPQVGLNPMTGGGVLPAEYFGGNSGRYFEAGSPELNNCTTAYGVAVPTSHGVVMDSPNSNYMGPNLAPYPNWLDMTGGGRRRRRKSKSKGKGKKSKGKKSKSRKSKGRVTNRK
jgi:hypothetical protein|tara:strand:- start:665 stop:1261 length:597 start_codon:yes stop_codon:yes gene_type:complete